MWNGDIFCQRLGFRTGIKFGVGLGLGLGKVRVRNEIWEWVERREGDWCPGLIPCLEGKSLPGQGHAQGSI